MYRKQQHNIKDLTTQRDQLQAAQDSQDARDDADPVVAELKATIAQLQADLAANGSAQSPEETPATNGSLDSKVGRTCFRSRLTNATLSYQSHHETQLSLSVVKRLEAVFTLFLPTPYCA